ncbi:MAG: hypothetical protein ACI4WS_06120 [Oscillospiraceae bacterium]
MPSNPKDNRHTYYPTPSLNSNTLREIGYTVGDLYPIDIIHAGNLRTRGIPVYHVYPNRAVQADGALKPKCHYGVRKSDWDKELARSVAKPSAWSTIEDAKKCGAVIIYRQNNDSALVYDPSDLAANDRIDRNTFDIIDISKVLYTDAEIESTVLHAISENRRFSINTQDCMRIGDIAAAFDVDGNQIAAYILGFHGLEKLPEFVQKNHMEDKQMNHGITDNGNLKPIEIDKYESDPDHPNLCHKTGQITYQEAFDQLKDHLEYLGMLPSEYFELSPDVFRPEDPVPDNWCDFTSNAVFGSSEGIFLDIYLNTSDGTKRFATGKTLNASTESYIWMSRIAAECNLMLNGNGCEMLMPQDVRDILEQKAKAEDEQLYYEDSAEESDEWFF